MRAAWLKVEDGAQRSRPSPGAPSNAPDSGDIGAFMAMPHVSGGWVGPPGFRVEDVMRMAEEAKSGKH